MNNTKGIITLCYRKVIDVNSVRPWEKMVFLDSYAEFNMQAQYFDQHNRYCSFAELIHHVPTADKLHFLVSAAVTGYVRQLHERIPDLLNVLGRRFLKFNNFQFEIINSDRTEVARHQVALSFYSEPLTWHDTINDHLLLSDPMQQGDEVLTHLFKLPAFVNIHSLKTS